MVWITVPNEYDEKSKQWCRQKDLPQMQNIVINKKSFIDHTSALSVDSSPHATVRATGILCNIGYTVNRDVETLQKMMQAGMNIARIQLSLNHEDLDHHAGTIQNIRQAAENYSKILGVPYPVAIASNTIGSEVRTGYLEGGEDAEIELITGHLIKITTDPAYKNKCSAQVIYCDYEDIISKVVVGRIIFIDDGEIKLEVVSIAGAFLTCKILMGGILGNERGINLPGTKVDLPALSQRDLPYIKFAIKNKIDFIFCSFVKNKSAVLEIRKILGKKGRNIKLISKIEDVQGYQNIEEIISVSDGIVVARGDLYLEYPYPKLFITQKYITSKCIRNGCPVMIARELMESMLAERLPTRAEVCDVGNAVLDGADIVMLARETMKGNRGAGIVKFVSQICKEAEAINWRTSSPMFNDWTMATDDITNTLSMTAVDSSIMCRAAAILAVTDSDRIVKVLSKYRPRCPIVAITRSPRLSRQLHLHRAVIPFLYIGAKKRSLLKDIDAQITAAIEFGKERFFIHSNDPLVIVIDFKHDKTYNNTMRIQYVTEEVDIIDDSLYLS